MSPTPKELTDEVCQLETFENLEVPSSSEYQDEPGQVRKRNVDPVSVEQNNNSPKDSGSKRLEVLFDGYYYDVTEFIKRHPGGDIMELYTDTREDATIAIQQFHYRSLKTVIAKMKGLKRRVATDEEIGLDAETKKRHEQLTKNFQALQKEMEDEGLMDANPWWFVKRMAYSFVMLVVGLYLKFFLAPYSLVARALSVIILTLAGGQCLWLGHEGGHRSVTGIPVLDTIIQQFFMGYIFGLSASCWNSTHAEHHAMPQHETKDADLKTMPLLAFNEKLVRDPKQNKFWLHYQHFLFITVDTFIVTLTWKFNHHLQYIYKHKCYVEALFMILHYSIIFILGPVDWMFITWLSSIYILGNLILSHTHFPLVEQGKKLHWVEYAFCNTTNVRSSYFGWVDYWMGHLNYQIEHHLFPAMPQYKGTLCRDKIKKFAKDNDLPYMLCSYWDAVKTTYSNLEHVGVELKHMHM